MKIRKAGGPEWFVSASRGMFLCLDFGVALEPSKSDGGFSHGPPTGALFIWPFFPLLATKKMLQIVKFLSFSARFYKMVKLFKNNMNTESVES